ncbi:MAG: hypothetical protein H6605_03975 [Flavobacteriales bacterium]|nr:hypothetical protein [Flavobacteriales bacterium]
MNQIFKIHFKILSLMFFVFLVNWVYSQTTFKTLKRTDGLPTKSIFSILQDKQGFIWAGTNDGVFRYDGYRFKTFKLTNTKKGGLKSKFILKIIEDRENRIWIGTSRGGISMYNKVTEELMTWEMDSTGQNGPLNWDAQHLYEDKKGYIWFTSGWVLQRIEKKGDNFLFTAYEIPKNPITNAIGKIYGIQEGPDQIIWFATTRGLFGFDKKTKRFLFNKDQIKGMDLPRINSITLAENNTYFFALPEGRLGKLEQSQMAPGKIPEIIEGQPENIFLNIQAKVLYDPKIGLICLGNGLTIVNLKQRIYSYKRFFYEPNNSLSLPSNLSRDFFLDYAGNWWIATDEGLSTHFISSPEIQIIDKLRIGQPEFNNHVSRILQDRNGYLWIAGDEGMIRFHLKKSEYKKIHLPGDDENLNGYVGGITEDTNGNIWAGVAPWLYKINPVDLSWKRYKIDFPVKERSDEITSIEMDTEGRIWISAFWGISCFDTKTLISKKLVTDYETVITQVYSYNSKTLYAVDPYFLYKIDKETMDFEPISRGGNPFDKRSGYLTLAKDMIIHGKSVYIATAEGLLIYDLVSKNWSHFTSENGLPNNYLRGLVKDKNNKIWISSNEGICCIDPVSLKISKLKVDEKLPCLEFTSRSRTNGNRGEIYFGCSNGIVFFNPADIKVNKYNPGVTLTDFKIFNKSVAVGIGDTANGKFTLNKSISYCKEIQLEHHQSFFTVEFASLSYLHSAENQYSYRLIGFNKDWINAGNNREATFTNLNPGNYVLEIRSANNSGYWNTKARQLKIIILPPWYRSTWAYFLYILLILFILTVLFRLRLNALRRKINLENKIKEAKETEREQFRKKSAADFHDEAGNKITKINLLTGLARSQASNNTELSNYLIRIEQNAAQLSSSMRDFIWVLDPDKDSLFDTILRIQDFGNVLFQDSAMSFKSDRVSDNFKNINLNMESRRAIIQIFKEAMHNSLKHSNGNSVLFQFVLKNSKLECSLQDNGSYNWKKDQKGSESYGLNIMNERADKIGANLWIDFIPSKGTRVNLKFTITPFEVFTDRNQ